MNRFIVVTTLALSLAFTAIPASASDLSEEGRYICATVSKILEPSDDAFYFKVVGDFIIKGNKEKILGIYMWDDKDKSKKEIAMVESSYKKKTRIHIFINDTNHEEGYAMLAERIESNCAINQPSLSAPVEGEYDGEFNGYLTVKQSARQNYYKVWLGVGAGSCGGETLVNNKESLLEGNRLSFNWKQKKHSCTTVITFGDRSADVSDSCISPESEEHSTCAMMGEYRKR